MEENKIYTGCGDKGYTQNAKCETLPKYHPAIELVGTIDEFTSMLGIARANAADEALKEDIKKIQIKLISVMGEISGGGKCVDKDLILTVEKLCDKYLDKPIVCFKLPGENMTSAILDMARSIVRRAERTAAKLLHEGEISCDMYVCLNRLSDLCYAMARYVE